ncbi:MAG: hypothetical protein EOO15_14325, partial [Chitinophagaceae bacterium]
AAKDAADLSEVLALSARKLLRDKSGDNVYFYNLNTGPGRDAFPDKESIRKAFADIATKAGPNDLLLVFFAGHGVTQGAKKQFYFLTADAGSNSELAQSGISITELNAWTRPDRIRAQKRILIFDACNSGQAINNLVTIGEKSDSYFAARNNEESERIKAVEKLRERAGMFILSASASNQFAYELGRYEQGVLTYALLRTIREQPSLLDGGRLLNVDRWFSATEQLVTEIVQATGNRQQPQKFGTGIFNVGVVDREVIDRIQLPSEKPLFIASFFLPENGLYDSLRFARLVNRRLLDVSARGAGSAFVFQSESDTPDACQLSGRYRIEGAMLIVEAAVVKDGRELFRLSVRGSLAQPEAVAVQLVTEAERRLAGK